MELMHEFSQLSHELLLVTDSDNAAFLSKLLEHSRSKDKANGEENAGILAHHPDLMTVITLDTTTRWLDVSVERSKALMEIRSFIEHVMGMVKVHAESSSPLHVRFSVLQSGLEVLLRMCMNSEACCQVCFVLK